MVCLVGGILFSQQKRANPAIHRNVYRIRVSCAKSSNAEKDKHILNIFTHTWMAEHGSLKGSVESHMHLEYRQGAGGAQPLPPMSEPLGTYQPTPNSLGPGPHSFPQAQGF